METEKKQARREAILWRGRTQQRGEYAEQRRRNPDRPGSQGATQNQPLHSLEADEGERDPSLQGRQWQNFSSPI